MENQMDTTKQMRMRHSLGIAVFSLCLFGLSLLLCGLLTSTVYAIFVSVLLFVTSIVLQILADQREHFYRYSMILNSLANGSVVSIYYQKIQCVPSLSDFCSLLLPLFLLILTYFLFRFLKRGSLWFALLILLLHIFLMVISVIGWVRSKGAFCSMAFFGLVFSMIYSVVLARIHRRPSRSILKSMSVGSFGILGIIIFVVFLLISEGEGFDGILEFFGDLVAEVMPRRKHTKP